MAYNPQFDLRGKRIEDTYNQVLQYDTSSGDSYTGQGLQLNITASWASQSLSSSYALTSSFALNGGGSGTFLTTGSTYPITSSWAISASYAPVQPSYSSSISIQKQNTLVTGNTYTITSSWSNNSISSSYSVSSSYVPNLYPQTTQVSCSWASSSISSSYSTTASLLSGTASYAISASYAPGSPAISASYALSASYAPGSPSISALHALTASYSSNAGSGGTTLTTGSTYPITASWSNNSISSSYTLTASYAMNGGSGGTQVSCSWASSSISASYTLTASYAMNGGSGGTQVSCSWASSSISASYSLSSSWSTVSTDTTNTLTNKRITPRILSAASYTTDTGTSLSCDNLDQFIVTAQAGALKFNNPSGTPTDGQKLLIAVTGTAARALTWDTQFETSSVSLPITELDD